MPGSASGSTAVPSRSPYSSRSLFPQAPTFSLETFADRNFNVQEFIEQLTESALPASRKSGPSGSSSGTPFDPKPLIRTFEHALKQLTEISGELEQSENEVSASVRRADAQYVTGIREISQKLEKSMEEFQRLEVSMSETDDDIKTGSILKVGDRLEELDRQRRYALDARFLVQCWLEVSERGELYLLEDMRKSGKGGNKVQCAQIARDLIKFSQKLDPEHWRQENSLPRVSVDVNGSLSRKTTTGGRKKGPQHNTREIIEKFLETLEQDLLKSFDECYRRQNFDGMQECAKVLHDFNDGASVIGAFVNQHQFFIEKSQLTSEQVAGDGEVWERLADPDTDMAGVEPSLQSLVDEVETVIKDESFIIRRAFPYPDQVLGNFIQRIFQQSIQQHLEVVLEKASSISSLAFLRSLQAARSCISSMINSLKLHGLTQHPEPPNPQIVVLLDQQLEELFVPYFAGSSYIEREKRSLEELFASLLFKFTIYHSRRRKAPTTFMKSLAKTSIDLLGSARDAYVERLDSSELAGPQKRLLQRLAGLKDSELSAKAQAENEVAESDGALQVENAKRMLKWLAEAVGRSLELSGGSDTAKEVSALLSLLLTNMGQIYIESALDAAIDVATLQESSKTEPDLAYILELRSAITILYLMSSCAQTVLLPLARSNTAIRREMERLLTGTMNRLEEKINAIMQKTIDVALAWISKLLAQQKKTDFRPRDDIITPSASSAAIAETNSYLEQLQTPTCQSIVLFLTRFHQIAQTAFPPSSETLMSYLTEIATAFRTAILDHFKKFQVSATGGIMVTKDMSKYVELLRSWKLDDSFKPSFDLLQEIGNLFVIGPEALKERLRFNQSNSTDTSTSIGTSSSSSNRNSDRDDQTLRLLMNLDSHAPPLSSELGNRLAVGQSATTNSGTSTGGPATPLTNSNWDARDLKPYVLRREDAGSVGVQSALGGL